ncbi:MAG: hypothetical protein M1816_003427 [Peltula sp. TS41687]|nr:MAG: hypothetical protein M1816_003427 [Peltula sp. TS41687]
MSKLLPPPLLHSLLSTPHLPPKTFHLLTTVTLCTLNLPHEIPHVYQHALSTLPNLPDEHETHAERLHLTRRIREALIKAAPISGLPKTINALQALKSATPPVLLDLPDASSSPSDRRAEILNIPSPPSTTTTTNGRPASSSLPPTFSRGAAFFAQTYGKITHDVQHNLSHSGTEDLGLLAQLYYAYIFSSNPHILSAAETSYVLIAALVPQDVNPQLKGHLRGALNNGAALENVRAVRDVVLRICEEAGMRRQLDGRTPTPGGGWGWGWGWRGGVEKL